MAGRKRLAGVTTSRGLIARVDTDRVLDAIERAKAAVENPPTVDPVEARVAELEVELAENDERRVGPWTFDEAEGALRCVAVRQDGVRVSITGWVPTQQRTGT